MAQQLGQFSNIRRNPPCRVAGKRFRRRMLWASATQFIFANVDSEEAIGLLGCLVP
jgi:hypothetical protein